MLSATRVRAAKAQEKRYRLTDANGLMLEVRPSGSKAWVLRYTHGGRRKDKTLGVYPAMSLQEARQAAAQAATRMERGETPFSAPASPISFRLVGQAFLKEKKPRIEHSYYRTIELRFNKYLYPSLGRRKISDIEVGDIRELLLFVAETRNETARKLHGLLSELYRFAALRGYVAYDPTQALKGLLKSGEKKHFPYVTDHTRLGEVLWSIDRSTAAIPVAIELRMLPHVFLRPAELRFATWDEIDLDEALWKIPAERMKMGRVHWVPLSRQVLDMLDELRTVAGRDGYLFKGARYGRPHSESLLNLSLKAVGIGSDVIVPHGFRHTASTLLHELGFDHAHIEKQLAHAGGNTVAMIYNHAEYLDTRRGMMQAWSDFLDGCKASFSPSR